MFYGSIVFYELLQHVKYIVHNDEAFKVFKHIMYEVFSQQSI